MSDGLEGCWRKTGKRWDQRTTVSRLFLLGMATLMSLLLISPGLAARYEERDYRDSFSTDFFFPYLDYNEKDGVIPGMDWTASSYTGEHRITFRGGIGTESGREHLQSGYTYLGWHPAIGANLFDKNTFYENISDSSDDEDDWLREIGGNIIVSWPIDVHHRIVPGYEISWLDLPDESERLNSVLLSLVRDTAKYYIIDIISGTQLNITGKYGDKALGSQRSFQSYTGDLRLYANLDLGNCFRSGKRLLAALRFHGGIKKDDPRFFHLGGEESLRGYDFNEFFGEKMWAASLELRYPVYVINRTTTAWDLFHFRQLLTVAFVDTGEIWRAYDDDDSISGVDAGVGGGVRLQMFVFGKIPFVVGVDAAQSITDTERDPKIYLVLKLGL